MFTQHFSPDLLSITVPENLDHPVGVRGFLFCVYTKTQNSFIHQFKKKTDVHWQYYSSSNHSQKILLATVLKWYVTDLKKLKQKKPFIAQWVSSCMYHECWIYLYEVHWYEQNHLKFQKYPISVIDKHFKYYYPSPRPPPQQPPTHTHS